MCVGVSKVTDQLQDPRGKTGDESVLSVAIVADIETGCVRLEFGKPISSLALTPELAVDLASLIVGKATEVMALHKPSIPAHSSKS